MDEASPPERVYPQTDIEVVYAGGTISSLATIEGHREGGHVVDLVGQLEERRPDLKGIFKMGQAEVAYTGLSENMDEGYWIRIEETTARELGRNPKAIIITHGTDSMEQTARRLKHTFGKELEERRIKIILTGANDDISHPQTDAWDNLQFAFESTKGGEAAGVYVAFHQKLIPADLVVKEPFNGVGMNYANREDLAYTDAVRQREEKTQEMVEKLRESIKGDAKSSRVATYDVNVIRSNNEDFINEVIDRNIKAVLLTLYHSGTANTESPVLSISTLIKKLREERGVVFFGVTENGEPVDLHSYETSIKLREAGVVPLYDMQKELALVKLQMAVSDSSKETIAEMLKSRVGEIDESKIIPEDIAKLEQLY